MKTIVEKFLKTTHCNPPKYKILEDQSVDILGNFVPGGLFGELPFQINESQRCDISVNELFTLKGSSRIVHENFNCAHNNKLQSLQFCPKFVKGNFYCSLNDIEPWEHRYLLFSEIQGGILTGNSELDLFFKRYQNQKAGIPEALKELREIQKRFELRIQKYEDYC